VRGGPLAAALAGALGALIASYPAAKAQAPATAEGNATLTAVPGVKVGHVTLTERPTGCTVILTEDGMIAGVDVRGAAPGTRDTELLSPENVVERVHAIVLSGGSAFGLDTATGVMRWLDEHKLGFRFGNARVPIVPAAILFDLGVGDASVRPTAECGYRAAGAATTDPVVEGSVGAGAGATVGKLRGMRNAMKGGIGSAAIRLSNGLIVAAIVASNGVGDVIDPATGGVIAGVRADDGRTLADARRLLRGGLEERGRPGEQTTLAVVATNATLTKTQATKIAQMAHDGFARAINPVHTQVDGDTIFALASGTLPGEPNLLLIGSLAAEVTADAVVRSVRQATGLPNLPAVRDLAR
jgi:L-aminopeptidase/D-esterase-like protein